MFAVVGEMNHRCGEGAQVGVRNSPECVSYIAYKTKVRRFDTHLLAAIADLTGRNSRV